MHIHSFFSPFPSAFIGEHDIIWCGMPICASSPSCVSFQPLAQPHLTPLGWGVGQSREESTFRKNYSTIAKLLKCYQHCLSQKSKAGMKEVNWISAMVYIRTWQKLLCWTTKQQNLLAKIWALLFVCPFTIFHYKENLVKISPNKWILRLINWRLQRSAACSFQKCVFE